MDYFLEISAEAQETLISLVGVVVSTIAILVGVLVAIVQIRRTHESNILLHKEQIKNEYKRVVHTEIDEAISILIREASQFNSALISITFSFVSYQSLMESSILRPFVKCISYQELCEKQESFNQTIFKIMGMIEKYEIVEPRLKLFNLVFGLLRHDISEVFTKMMMNYFCKILPNNSNPESPIPFKMPNIETENKLRQEIDVFQELNCDVCSYASDLRIEVQNTLLGDLFGNTLSHRAPENPKYKVITLVSPEYEKLLTHFQRIDERKISEIINPA